MSRQMSELEGEREFLGNRTGGELNENFSKRSKNYRLENYSKPESICSCLIILF